MRVVHILQSNIYSGAETVVCNIIDFFNTDDSIDMVYVSPKGPISKVLKYKKIKHYELDDFSQKELKKAIRVLKPDIIHCHDFQASVRVAFLPIRCPIVSHLHNNPLWIKKLNLKTILYLLCSLRYPYIIGVSESIKDEFFFSKAIKNKYIVIHNVVDTKRVLTMSNDGFSSDTDLSYVGRLEDPKNPLRFLKIVSLIKSRYNRNIRAQMIGIGSLKNKCEKYIESKNLHNNVKLLGFQDNPYKFLKNTKIVIMPSKWEGFGLVAVESLALGKPVVASSVGGLKDIISEDCGALCYSDDDFCRKTIELLSSTKIYNTKSTNAKINAIKYSDITLYKDRLKNLYFKIKH